MSDDPYGEAVLYDLEYAGHSEDIAWYRAFATQRPGPVVELGCGTGRLTLPLARAGARVHGVDRAPAMLEHLRRKLAREPADVRDRVVVTDADYTQFEPNAPPSTVLWPFNALHHLAGPDELRAMLARIRTWLAPGGRLALDCYLPDLELYDRDPDQRYEPRRFVDPRSGGVLDSWEQGWWDGATQTHHVLYVYRHEDGSEERAHLRLRMYRLPELHRVLDEAGWDLVQEAEDFEGSPVTETSLKWVGEVRPRR